MQTGPACYPRPAFATPLPGEYIYAGWSIAPHIPVLRRSSRRAGVLRKCTAMASNVASANVFKSPIIRPLAGVARVDVTERDPAIPGLQETYVESGDVRIHVVHAGKPEAPAVLFLHGFPDTWKLWRRQIPVFLEAGYRVVAPDLRGFGLSDKPTAVDRYKAALSVADMLRVLDSLSIAKASVVGHDWGTVVAWMLAARHGDRVEKLVAMAVGHPAANGRVEFRANDLKNLWYHYFFQVPGAEHALAAQDWKLLRDWLHDHPETDEWIANLSRPAAATAALNWFRANSNDFFTPEYLGMPAVKASTLGMFSQGDRESVKPEPLTKSKEFVQGEWRYLEVPAPSHWMQLDRPELVNREILDFLKGLP